MTDSKTENIINTETVREQLKNKGIDREKLLEQINLFKKGYPPMNISRPCTVGDGIHKLDKTTQKKMVDYYISHLDSVKTTKFVPASGAASRMFRDLVADYNALKENSVDTGSLEATEKFVTNIQRFAFYNDLENKVRERGDRLEDLIGKSRYLPLLDALLNESGLNYSNLPKGMIKFHKYGKTIRTAFEEHLAEGGRYLVKDRGTAHIHFTVPVGFKEDIKQLLETSRKDYYPGTVEFDLEYSVQEESTDTVAVNTENVPVTENTGELVFRPGGHGALLQNLNSINSDVIFIKNIDNVLPERYLEEITFYKMLISGLLLYTQHNIHGFLKRLEDGESGDKLFSEISGFCREYLYIDPECNTKGMSGEEKACYIAGLLNKPLRVCGMVKNEGEPGGGPFWTEKNGATSLQIVESAQIDMNDPDQARIWESSTHFNPVDIVCGVRDFKGRKFDLVDFVDHDAGIITEKTFNGTDIKALELPGLWNGSMSDWITVFVEVPVETFSPVKTVFDLLRDEHQGAAQLYE